MSSIHNWTVVSNSFGKPESSVQGETLEMAIQSSIGRIVGDALPKGNRWKALKATAEWQPGIIKGRGGVEVVIDARFTAPGAEGTPGQFIIWIMAPRSDLREVLSIDLENATV